MVANLCWGRSGRPATLEGWKDYIGRVTQDEGILGEIQAESGGVASWLLEGAVVRALGFAPSRTTDRGFRREVVAPNLRELKVAARRPR